MRLNVLSLFDGISCGRVALERAGIEVGKYFASEIDKYAIEISKKNYPDIVHIGSVTGVQYEDGAIFHHQDDNPMENGGSYIADIDMIIGGSPCQDLSRAKKDGKGLQGEKSGLFFEYMRILKEVQPKYFLLENVASMKPADRDEITRIIGVQPIFINSSVVSGQNRRRLYWTNIPGIEQPKDRGIVLRDILEDIPMENEQWKPIPEKYITEDFKVRIREATKKGYVEPDIGDCVDMTQENSKTRRGRLMQGGGKTNALLTGNNIMVISIREKSLALDVSYAKQNIQNYITKSQGQVVIGQFRRGTTLRIHADQENAPTLTSNMGTGGNNVPIMIEESEKYQYVWRKLTPIECERLQTLPDNYTDNVSNSQRYKAIGNGWTVDVISHLLSFIPTE